MNKKFIIDNAYQAWIIAIQECKKICSGYISFQIKKSFVSALHNSSELFIKQIMLNSNNHDVMSIPKKNLNIEPYYSFLHSADLNLYFNTLSTSELSKFHSIQYGEIISEIDNVLAEYFLNKDSAEFKTQMQLLQELRNNETHFYISTNEFLNEQQFTELYNFMCELYKVIEYYELLPFWGKPIGEHSNLWFDFKPMKRCVTFYELIKYSPKNKKIAENIDEEICPYNLYTSTYYICDFLYCQVDKVRENVSFNEFLIRMTSLIEHALIESTFEEIIEEDENGNMQNNSYYIFVSKF